MRNDAGAAIVMTAVLALAMGALSSTAGAEEASTKLQSQNDASKFSYVRLYCGPDHETHFADLTAELAEQNFAPPAAPIYIGGAQPSSCVFFAGFGPHWGAADRVNHLYHPAPAIQFLAVAQGVFSITATDGETRQLHPGDVVHLEDVAPCKGHITVVGDTVGFMVFAR
ncbi:MAG TPA: hypothetical protein VGL12_16475 [Roseiarcus sp.]